MDNRIYINPYVRPSDSSQINNRATNREHISFDEVLSRKLDPTAPLRFSKHAEQRIKDRQMNLTPAEIAKLADAVSRAQAKGVKSSLILMHDKAFIVSINNNTIVTAIDNEHLKDNVFTNIDGAVIV